MMTPRRPGAAGAFPIPVEPPSTPKPDPAQLYAALDEGYMSESDFNALQESCLEVGRLMAGFMDYLAKTETRGQKSKPMAGCPN